MNTGFSFQSAQPTRKLSLTPLIDVVFILLLFFMLASRFEHWQAQAVDTSSAPAADSRSDSQALVINVARGGHLTLDGLPIARQALETALLARLDDDPAIAVFVAPVPGLRVQALMSVIDRVRAVGVTAVEVGSP